MRRHSSKLPWTQLGCSRSSQCQQHGHWHHCLRCTQGRAAAGGGAAEPAGGQGCPVEGGGGGSDQAQGAARRLGRRAAERVPCILCSCAPCNHLCSRLAMGTEPARLRLKTGSNSNGNGAQLRPGCVNVATQARLAADGTPSRDTGADPHMARQLESLRVSAARARWARTSTAKHNTLASQARGMPMDSGVLGCPPPGCQLRQERPSARLAPCFMGCPPTPGAKLSATGPSRIHRS